MINEMYMEEICILLAGLAGVFIARVVIKLVGLSILKLITSIYYTIEKILYKCFSGGKKK